MELTPRQTERLSHIANVSQQVWDALAEVTEDELLRMLQSCSPFEVRQRTLLSALIGIRHFMPRKD